jgi:hypothetical protein
MIYKFNESLKAGAAGEDKVQQLYPDWVRTDGRIADFITPDGKKIEVKTERRTTAETPNLALELASSPGRPGAIERAVADGIDYILYQFADDIIFVYQPVPLLSYMNENKHNYRQVNVNNGSYHSTVLLVPRIDLRRFECKI